MVMVEHTINYDNGYKNNFRGDVRGAVLFYLSAPDWTELILYPQAINPFLKIMETVNEAKNISIFPAFDNEGEGFSKPAYLVLKMQESRLEKHTLVIG